MHGGRKLSLLSAECFVKYHLFEFDALREGQVFTVVDGAVK